MTRPAELEAFLDRIFSALEGPISIKTRLGYAAPEEFSALLELYNRYPIAELIIHPRVRQVSTAVLFGWRHLKRRCGTAGTLWDTTEI